MGVGEELWPYDPKYDIYCHVQMRAARLLHLLLLLQNRGKMTSAQLAEELEVAPRTILRDIDALTEAGLPLHVTQGNQGGIELAFGFRTRLTGLSAPEAEALGLLLQRPLPELDAVGLGVAARMAQRKLFESLPDATRAHATRAQEHFRYEPAVLPLDERVAAMAAAIRGRHRVRLQATTSTPRTIHPCRLHFGAAGWAVADARDEGADPIPLAEWGDVNVSALSYE